MEPKDPENIDSLILEKLDKIHERQVATAGAVRDLAAGVTLAEARHQREQVDLSKLEAAVLTLSPKTDLAIVTAHDLANSVKPEVINKARAIQWARRNGDPEPLPDTPDELVPVHLHHRKDDSIEFKKGPHGEAVVKANVKVKTLVGWGFAVVLGVLHVIRLIADALHGQ